MSAQRLVVFDLDGTLVDSTQALLAAHDAAWASVGLPRPADAQILPLVGLPLVDTMARLSPRHDAEALAQAYSRAYASAAPRHERLFEGVTALLQRPFRAAVATGKSQRGAERAVRRHGWADRFEIVLGGDPSRRPKPFPDLLVAIVEATGCDELVMVGDTTYDLEMAAAAGVAAVGVSWGHHHAEALRQWAPVVDTVEQLINHLGV